MVRKGLPADVRFLRDMLHHAYYWRERAANPALKLYERHGFEKVAETDDGSWTMMSWLESEPEST